MNVSRTVAKNSLWLIIQPVVLSILALVSIPLFARLLGDADYGRFILGFSLVAMLLPATNMGLRAITVRQIASDRRSARDYASQMLGARLVLSFGSMLVIALLANLLGYDDPTKLVVYLASLTLVGQALESTYQDVFQAFEEMQYVAYSRVIGGVLQTLLSVAILLLGAKVIGLTLSYIAGSVVTMGLAWLYARRFIGNAPFRFDWAFLRRGLGQGLPFSLPTIILIVSSKVGVAVLPLFGGIASVGAYGIAISLTERLTAISEGVSTAVYPTLSILYKTSPVEAAQLYKRCFEYLLIMALPMAVGVTIVAEPIVLLLFGVQYRDAAPILQIQSWWLFIAFLTSLQSWTLAAIHQEKRAAVVAYIAGPLGALLTLALVSSYRGEGIAAASVISAGLALFLYGRHIHHCLGKGLVSFGKVLRIIMANLGMGIVTYLVRHMNLAVPLLFAAITYPLFCLVLRVMTLSEIRQLLRLVAPRSQAAANP